MMNENVSAVSEKKNNNYYFAIDDVEVFRGKRGQMQPDMDGERPCSCRVMLDKFQRDPKRAAELVFLIQDHNRRETCCPDVIADFWKKVKYDKENKTYVYEELRTIGTFQPPKQCQLEEFYRGNYEFYMIRHEIQVLKTELVKAC